MKHLIIITVVFVTGMLSAQSIYDKGMEKALELWKNNQWAGAEQVFVRIAVAVPDAWSPNYYIVQLNSVKTWGETDATKLRAQLEKAQNALNDVMTLDEDNADLLVRQAQILTNWVAFDGITYGVKYSVKILGLFSKVYALAPNNPMVLLGKTEWIWEAPSILNRTQNRFVRMLKRPEIFLLTLNPNPLETDTLLHSVEESITGFKENKHHYLMFLDIQLGDGLSFEIFEALEINWAVIFTTAYHAYAFYRFSNSIVLINC